MMDEGNASCSRCEKPSHSGECFAPAKPPLPKSLTITGRRWFNRTWGNTYFSAAALIDGKPAGQIDYAYGYGNQYEHAMFAKLEKDGLITGVEHIGHGSEAPWRWCGRNGVAYSATVADVARKKDL